MKEFSVPLMSVDLKRDTLNKLLDLDVEEISLEYLKPAKPDAGLYSKVTVIGGVDGLGILFCSEITGRAPFYTHNQHKSKVFMDDCVEAFIQPDQSPVYYGFEMNGNPSWLDYRVFVNNQPEKEIEKVLASSKPFDGKDIINGYLKDNVAGTDLMFDYDWTSSVQVETAVEEGFWYLSCFIPWENLGLKAQPVKGDSFRGTFNRIDVSSKIKGKFTNIQTPEPDLLCLLDNSELPAFHQPEKFAHFTFV